MSSGHSIKRMERTLVKFLHIGDPDVKMSVFTCCAIRVKSILNLVISFKKHSEGLWTTTKRLYSPLRTFKAHRWPVTPQCSHGLSSTVKDSRSTLMALKDTFTIQLRPPVRLWRCYESIISVLVHMHIAVCDQLRSYVISAVGSLFESFHICKGFLSYWSPRLP